MTKKSQVRNLPRLQRHRVKFSKRDFWLDTMCTIQNDPFFEFWCIYLQQFGGNASSSIKRFSKKCEKSQVRNLPHLQRQRVKFLNRDFWLDIMCTIQNHPFLNFGAHICGNLAGTHPFQLRNFQK